jgi:hypothetical protein
MELFRKIKIADLDGFHTNLICEISEIRENQRSVFDIRLR